MTVTVPVPLAVGAAALAAVVAVVLLAAWQLNREPQRSYRHPATLPVACNAGNGCVPDVAAPYALRRSS